MTTNIHQGDALSVLRGMPSESMHSIVTSSPYWGLRDYGTVKWKGGKAGCDPIGSPQRIPVLSGNARDK
jgi:DNA modification methylase